MMFYLHTKFHDNWISSFRGVAMTRFWDGQTDGVTALLDLLSPLASQVKTFRSTGRIVDKRRITANVIERIMIAVFLFKHGQESESAHWYYNTLWYNCGIV